MSRYKITLEYNGTGLIGWQENAGGVSVQSLLQTAIFKFSGEHTDVVGCGRTDAGVHALGAVAHFDLVKDTDAETVMRAINFYLKDAPVVVLNSELVTDEFHARFSCKRRNYKYIILNRNTPPVLDVDRVWWVPRALDFEAMKLAATKFIGNHDFTSFRASECQSKSPVKTMDSVDVSVIDTGYGSGQYIVMTFTAQSFLHHQIRNIAGTLVEIGLGKPYDIDAVFAAKDRSAAGPTAPSSGLYFVSAEY